MSYQEKYLKYKLKYLNAKKQLEQMGGTPPQTDMEFETCIRRFGSEWIPISKVWTDYKGITKLVDSYYKTTKPLGTKAQDIWKKLANELRNEISGMKKIMITLKKGGSGLADIMQNTKHGVHVFSQLLNKLENV
jgi:hypothetical protein